MKLIIVGGDKVAYYLVRQLAAGKYDITVIETRIEVCRRLANDTEVTVFNGDGTNREVLEEAGCMDADMLIALTGKDENNLVACQLAKHDFNVKTTLAKLNNPKNREVFGLFGVDRIYSSTQILGSLIDMDIEYDGMEVAFNIPRSSKNIVELQISPNSSAVGKSLEEFTFPFKANVVLLTRQGSGEAVIPNGSVVMEAGDHMLLVCDEKDYGKIWNTLVK